MSHKLALSSALAAALTLGVVTDTVAGEERVKKEKCYGVSLAGQNDCSNIAGTHSCAGQSTVDNDPGEWRLVTKGQCKIKGGLTSKEARAKIKQQS
ncbi:DUF2282 domain-containing protein [Pseudocolwellia agarivorans]|uniref:BufA1 family periplasmic bufferin-type metallophore n=1 Tax=Pseudocolwellia agarivorans TaxID=1911682 RepID=UPI0009850522|nr:DUF2282 domain-containing protein [Pseudocolwellia agarivorans]